MTTEFRRCGSLALQGCCACRADPHLPHGAGTESLREQLHESTITYTKGCDVESVSKGDEDEDAQRAEFDSAVAAATDSDIVIAIVGDRAGLFGRGTVGEGNDADSLELPGRQRALVEALCATGKPTILVLLTGRPYAIPWAFDDGSRPAAVLQAFFPGEEGGEAIADVLVGTVNPSGHLPVSLPRSTGVQPFTYLHPALGGASEITSLDPSPVRPFGFGLSYTSFTHRNLEVSAQNPTDQDLTVSVTVQNTGENPGTDLVQLYGHDRVASVTRPVAQLLAYSRVDLQPGEEARVTFTVPSSRLSLIDRSLDQVVEPGKWDLWVGPSCEDREVAGETELTGQVHPVALRDQMRATTAIEVIA